jgi:hypothetical protein
MFSKDKNFVFELKKKLYFILLHNKTFIIIYLA